MTPFPAELKVISQSSNIEGLLRRNDWEPFRTKRVFKIANRRKWDTIEYLCKFKTPKYYASGVRNNIVHATCCKQLRFLCMAQCNVP